MKDMVVLGMLVVAFAILVTAHVTIVVGLARRVPRWHAPVAFFVAPLAPWWALRDRMRVRAVAWILGFVLYVVAFVLGTR